MTSGPVSHREKRKQPRYTVRLPVRVSDTSRTGAGEIHFDTRDLSVAGAFLQADLLFEVGEELALQFELPDGPVDARGRVVRAVREPEEGGTTGMGLAFDHLQERDRERVRAFLTNR